MGGMVRDAHCTMAGRKLGGNFVMIMMLLLVSIIIYYDMNTFITLRQCTFNLLSALFLFNLPIVVARQQCITS